MTSAYLNRCHESTCLLAGLGMFPNLSGTRMQAPDTTVSHRVAVKAPYLPANDYNTFYVEFDEKGRMVGFPPVTISKDDEVVFRVRLDTG